MSSPARRTDIDSAYRYCLDHAARHYENFPVASKLLPAHLRRPVAAIYSFARTADDIADEGRQDAASRLRALDELEHALLEAVAGRQSGPPPVVAVADTIRRRNLSVGLFKSLLVAYRQDVTRTRYADFGEVMQYCRHSANPVGRLLLQLVNQADERNLAYSDGICAALQLINFYQDLHQDYHEHNRIYLPGDEMARHGVDEGHLRDGRTDAAMRRLMAAQYRRAHRLLRGGAPLGRILKGRFGLEIRMVILGGERILRHLETHTEDVFARPRLNRQDWIWMLWHALRKK